MSPVASLSAIVRAARVDLALVRTMESAAAAAADVVLAFTRPPDPRAAAMIDGLARRHGARVVAHAEGASEGRLRNLAVRASRGEAVLLLDAGDRADPVVAAALARAVAEGAAIAAAPVRVTRGFGTAHLRLPPEATVLGMLARADAVPSAFVLSRRAFEAASGFDETLPALADADLWVRAHAHGGVFVDARPLVDRPLEARPAVAREAADALFRKHAAALEAEPAAVLGALERHMASLSAAQQPELDRRAGALAELAALDAEIARLEDELRAMGRHSVDWGDLRRPSPVSREWGYDRGTPMDRPYIERFLAAHAADVAGVVLEVQEPDYTTRFGGAAVTRSEVVDVHDGNPRATVLADLRHADGLASDTYDCFILTQTLHVIGDVEAAIAEAYRVLRPGGVLLATFPAASRVCVEYGPEGDYWRVTEAGARALVETSFPADAVSVHAYGNVLATTAFLQGLAAHELTPEEIAGYDPYFPMVLGVRAQKPGGEAAVRAPLPRRTGLPRVKSGGVLLYHRIGDPLPDVHGLAVPAPQFRAQLEMLRSEHEVVALAELRRWIDAGRDPAGLLALTFDDGYLDNLVLASPILVEMELPATFFVTTEHLGGPGEFWWDTLERILLTGKPLPPALSWNGAERAETTETATAEGRRQAHVALHRRLVAAPLADRRAMIARLLEWSGRTAPGPARPLVAAEVRELAGRAGHEVGGHGVHHLALGAQPPEVVRSEVEEAVRALGQVLGGPVRAFAYPYGDVSDVAVAAVRAAGLETAVTCVEEAVRRDADPLRLPRLEVKAGPAEDLAERLWRLLR